MQDDFRLNFKLIKVKYMCKKKVKLIVKNYQFRKFKTLASKSMLKKKNLSFLIKT